MSSQPAEKRMNPSGTSSVAQRARRSAVEWTPPKLVASLTSSHSSRKVWAASAVGSANDSTGPTPGQRTCVRSSRRASASTSACALACARSSRSPSVASDRCASHASNGPRMAPVRIRHSTSSSASASSRTLTAPSSTSECPVSAFVPDVMAKSAPWSSGRWPSGVATVLSIAASAPAECAAATTASRSQTSRRGFDGVSTQTSVAPSQAATIRSVSVGTSRTSMPLGARSRSAIMRIPG